MSTYVILHGATAGGWYIMPQALAKILLEIDEVVGG